jgi:hypothetical protein
VVGHHPPTYAFNGVPQWRTVKSSAG